MNWRIRWWAVAGVLSVMHSSHAVAQIDREAPKYTPTFDGTVTPDEMAGQLRVSLAWPVATGALLLEGSGIGVDDLSAEVFLSWDDVNLNISAIVRDNTPDFRLSANGTGNVPYNGQDVFQPTFNPFNDPDHFFQDPAIPADEDPDEYVASIYDIVVNTSDEFGPDIYRRPPLLDDDQRESITVIGQETETGYILETALPWAVAMDDVEPDYVPQEGDTHGLGFILLSFNGEEGGAADVATLYTDFGEGINTIADATTWNSLTLTAASTMPGDFNGNGMLDSADLNDLTAQAAGLMHVARYDLNADALVDGRDIDRWIGELYGSWIGDANLDGEFNSSDLVLLLAGGAYEAGSPAVWSTGDFNGDGQSNASDLVVALSGGGYEQGPRAAHAVPEPTAPVIGLLAATLASFRLRRRR